MGGSYAKGFKFFSRANARAQENFGRVQSASAEDGFFRIKLVDASLTPYFHARDSVTVYNYALDLGVGDDGEVVMICNWLEVCVPGVEAISIFDIRLNPADAFGGAGVVVFIQGNAGLLPGFQHGVLQRIGFIVAADIQKTILPAGVGIALRIVFNGFKNGQDLIPGPAIAAEVCPGVIVFLCPAHPDGGVQSMRAAHDLATWDV